MRVLNTKAHCSLSSGLFLITHRKKKEDGETKFSSTLTFARSPSLLHPQINAVLFFDFLAKSIISYWVAILHTLPNFVYVFRIQCFAKELSVYAPPSAIFSGQLHVLVMGSEPGNAPAGTYFVARPFVARRTMLAPTGFSSIYQ